MLISNEKKFIFLKTIKTGSTSIENYLQKYCSNFQYVFDSDMEKNFEFYEHIEDEKGIITVPRFFTEDKSYYWDHMPALELKSKIDAGIWDDYLKFCVIRNPFEKMVSMMFHIMKRNKFYIGEGCPIKYAFEYQLSDLIFNKKEEKDFYSDSDFFTIDNKLIVDDYIRYENLETDMKRICDKLNIDFNYNDLPKVNSQYRPKWAVCKDLYTDASRKMVEDMFKFELDYFGYTFPE